MYVATHGTGNAVTLDFFCKTAETKTVEEQKYCDDYYTHNKKQQVAGIVFMIVFIAVVVLLFPRRPDTAEDPWFLLLIMFGVPLFFSVIAWYLI